MQCPRCPHANPVAQKFCGECGTPTTGVAVARPYEDLKDENERLRHSLAEAQEQQVATHGILRVIANSPTELQFVLDAMAERAASLCAASDGVIHRLEGDFLRLAAHHGPIPGAPRGYRQPAIRGTVAGRSVRDGTTVHVVDLQTEVVEFPEGSAIARRFGHRTTLGVPLLREGVAIGAIVLRRTEVRPFSDTQIELLKTFADQAVIAIENARLFTELQASNRDLTEALEQQVATAEILRVISASPTDLQPVFDAIAHSAVRLCSGVFGVVYRLEGDIVHLVAHHNFNPEAWASYQAMHPMPASRSNTSGRAMLDARVAFTEDTETDVEQSSAGRRVAMAVGARSVVSVPMLRDGASVGAITVARREPGRFSDKQVALLQTFADQAVIAVENVRLFKELEARNRDLTEALAQQTATADILRVISSSPTDVQPVFDAIADSALRLLRGWGALVVRFDGHLLHAAAIRGGFPGSDDALRRRFPAPVRRGEFAGEVILDRAVKQIADVETDEVPAGLRANARVRGWRANLGVPMMHDGQPIGVLTVTRAEPGAFSSQEVELLKTFADQAVIAIENVRLFKALQTRNSELTEALEQQTATSEILRVISRSQTDVEPVFNTIAERVVRLCDGLFSGVFRFEGNLIHFVAHHNFTVEGLEEARRMYPRTPSRETQVATAILDRTVVEVRDVENDPGVSDVGRSLARALGYRSNLVVPMLLEGNPIGAIAVARANPGPFSVKQIALLETFANQAVIAIENGRLLRELEEKGRQLEAASQHKSEFLANMSHELRTPLNAIIGFSEVLSDRMFGELNDKQAEYLKDIYASGTHLLSLINDILDLSKIEAGRMELEVTDFDLPQAIDNALTLVRERAGRRGIRLESTIDERLGEVRADERKIRQVVLNLLSNAIKFTPEGGRIEVAAVPKDGSVEVSVSDTGVGIAPEDQEAVFEEFRQVGTSAAKQEGTGLGLALCRKFVELHGGGIRVLSEVGRGSTFTFTIPVRRGE